MEEICSVCGLPKDICVCGDLDKSSSIISIKKEKRKYNKVMTIIRGLQLRNEEMKKLTSEIKSKCASGGTLKNGEIEIQGDHVDKIYNILKEKGFKVERI